MSPWPSDPSPITLEDAFAVLYADGDLVFQADNKTDSSRTTLHADVIDVNKPWWTWNTDSASDSNTLYDRVVRVVSDAPVIASGDISKLFYGCSSLSDISALAAWDVSSVTDFSDMFFGCSSLEDVSAVADWEGSRSANVADMFYDCPATLPSWYRNPYFSPETLTLWDGWFTGSDELRDDGHSLVVSGPLVAAASENEFYESTAWTIGPGTYEVPISEKALFGLWYGDSVEYHSRDDFDRCIHSRFDGFPGVDFCVYCGELVWADVHS